ncbi:MAG TPA: hypothetical protein VFS23_14250 [Vicinamibacterales bacterium]|nr:hypothetical protein [Vicinamibacterales bacterium]
MAGVMLIVGLSGPVNAPLSAADNGFDKVILSQEYTFGLGGMTIIEFRPYLLFKDGSILRSPSDAPADLDVSRSRAARPKDWGRFAITSDRIQVQWGDGKSQTIDKWWTARPATSGGRLSGPYRYSGGSGNTALGGSAMVVRSSQYRFNTDGTFSNDTFGGGSNSSLGVQTAAGSGRQGGGSYHLDGYTIELKTTDGRVQRLLFFFFPDSEDAIGVGNQVLSKQK